MSTENASAQAAEGQELPADTTQQNGTDTENQEQPAEKTYTQTQVNEIVQKRVAKLERQQTNASDQRYTELQREIEALKGARTATAESKTDSEPKRDSFDTYEDYIEARADYRADKKARELIESFRGETKANQEKSTAAERQRSFDKVVQSRIEAGRKEFADFDSVITEAIEDGVLDTKSAMYQGVIDSDMAHKLAYHLAKNPSEASRIQGLSAAGQIREIGKLEDKLSAKKERGETMEPIGGRTQNVSGLRDDMSTEAWIKQRNAALKKR